MGNRALADSLTFAPPAVEVTHTPEGALLVRSRHALARYARCTGEYLEHWARTAPDRRLLAERGADGGWHGVTFGEALERVRSVGSWLLERRLGPERPVMVLSENGVEHGLLMLSCLHVGIPIASISPAYSLVSKDFAKLRSIVELLRPGVVYAADERRFGPALEALRGRHDGLLVSGGAEARGDRAVPFAELTATRADGAAVERAFSAISPDSIAKFLFTSGSTGDPKAVINTHRMLCSNQDAIRVLWPFLEEPPVLVDWLPWHHTFGGNHNFNLVLRNGGTLYIDAGRPVPGHFEKTLANLREIAPSIVLNVPRGYDLLVGALREDAALRDRFFSRLRLLFYAAASLPQNLWDALGELSVQSLGRAVPMVSSWGLTETAPAATSCHYVAKRAGVVGLPVPGCEIKLVPSGDRLEARVRGPNVTPGYWRQPELTRSCFDEEGFFRTGDAMRLADPQHPEQGLLFDGRLGENFKLSTATWVHVGALRVKAIAALAPVAQDVVVTGHDRDEVGLLVFPNLEECRRLCRASADTPLTELLSQAGLRARVAAGLHTLAISGGGSSTYPTRALFLSDAPSIDAGEITDKGYVNQRAVLVQRAALVERLYRAPLDPAVITPCAEDTAAAAASEIS